MLWLAWHGYGVAFMVVLAFAFLTDVLDGLAANPEDNSAVENAVQKRVEELCARFPIYSDF